MPNEITFYLVEQAGGYLLNAKYFWDVLLQGKPKREEGRKGGGGSSTLMQRWEYALPCTSEG